MFSFARLSGVLVALCVLAATAHATAFSFSTGAPDGLIATTSRSDLAPVMETETADDFVLTSATALQHATFTGIIVGGASLTDIADVGVEIYRVFPLDSTVPPSDHVPTRVNSPSDVALEQRTITDGTLNFATVSLGNFTANNSVLNGINPKPGQTTAGEGPVTGLEVIFDVTFTTPIVLQPDHYFFVPQVNVTGGDFLWLSAPHPVSSSILLPDLQTWIRNENLAPDWLRVGTDVVGGAPAPQFNGAFSLDGRIVPEPASVLLLLGGLGGLGATARRRKDR
jgi:hypothetical protein